jgi:flotillin
MEEQARGDAARIVELGRAEAQSLRGLVEQYQKAGPHAREVLALQQMMPMLSHIVGAQHPVHIKKMSFLPADSDGGDLARKAIATVEQLRAATGVDLADMARRVGGRPAAPSEPPPARRPTVPPAPPAKPQ